MRISQALERDGWTGLEEVTRLLNGNEFAVTGKTLNRLNAVGSVVTCLLSTALCFSH